jgi:hypothetical protein
LGETLQQILFHKSHPRGFVAAGDQVDHELARILSGPDDQISQKAYVLSSIIRSPFLFQGQLTHLIDHLRARRTLQVADVEIQNLVKASGNVQSQSKASIQILATRYFSACQPATGPEGELHLVSILKLLGRRQNGTDFDRGQPPDSTEKIFHLLPFERELSFIISVLPTTASTSSEMRATRLDAVRRRLQEFFQRRLGEPLSFSSDQGSHTISGNGIPDKYDKLIHSTHRHALESGRFDVQLYQLSFAERCGCHPD